MIGVSDIDQFVFVVGAPRCGTTTLAYFLRQHPEICFPIVKEPHFFAQHDLREKPAEQVRTFVEEEYLRRFFPCAAGRRTGVDASVTYLYVPEQLEPALRLWPNSKFVIALRDPLEMLPSLHRRLIYNGDETIRDFEDAWLASSERAFGRRVPRRCAEPRWLRYDEAGRFATYLERLFATVGRDRCHVVLFDDLAGNPAREYRRLFNFLGLEGLENPDLTPRRSGADVKIQWLQRLLKRPPQGLRDRLAGEKFNSRFQDLDRDGQSGPSKILSMRKQLLRWNRVPPRPLLMPIDTQHQIRAQLQPEVDRLGKLLSRDLRGWLQPVGS